MTRDHKWSSKTFRHLKIKMNLLLELPWQHTINRLYSC